MAESQPDESQLNGGAPPLVTTYAACAAVVGSKRQRRPSVRLGEIGGDQYHHVLYDSYVRRSAGNKQWRPLGNNKKDSNPSGKASRTRTLKNLSSDYNCQNETLEDDREGNLDSIEIGSWRVKKRVEFVSNTKRVRCNWVSFMDENQDNISFGQEEERRSREGELKDGYQGFNGEELKNSLKEQSPENHGKETEWDYTANNRRMYDKNNNRGSIRARVSDSREFEISEPWDMDGGDWRNGRGGGGEMEGVRIWLDGLGLGRYWPVFEIHEVDDEVLPLLTLEDLKDMGIDAVGSRRKMYCAIQKLGKEFS